MHVRVLAGKYAGHIFEVGSLSVLLDPDSEVGTPYWPDEVEVIVWESPPNGHTWSSSDPEEDV